MHNGSASNPWLVRFSRADEPRLRLFCFPYAGGGAGIFRTWSQLLPPDIEVWAIQPPGREQRIGEPAITDAVRVSELAASAMTPWCDVPFALFGHSMGAALAYETSRVLMGSGVPAPDCVLVSAHRAPHLPSRKKPTFHLPDALFIEELRRLNGTPPAVFEHRELMELMLPLLRADFQLANSYQASSPEKLPCPVIVFGGTDDTDVSLADLKAWQDVASDPVRVHVLEGDHFFLISRQKELTGLITRELAAVGR